MRAYKYNLKPGITYKFSMRVRSGKAIHICF